MTKVNLQTLKDKKVILTSRIYNGLGVEQLIMIPITDSDEMIIDNIMSDKETEFVDEKTTVVIKKIESITLQNYTIKKDNVLAYGHINLKDNSKDFLSLETLKLHNFDIHKGVKIPNNYDYENNCCYVEKGKRPNYLNSPTLQMDGIDWTTTTNIAKVIQYNHGMLGKPNKVVIFTNFIYNKK